MTVVAALLIPCSVLAAQAADWIYIVPPHGDPFEHPSLRALALSDAKPLDLQEKIAYRGTRQQYGRLHLGSPASPNVAVVLDRITSPDTDLYLDVNRNRIIEPSDRVIGSDTVKVVFEFDCGPLAGKFFHALSLEVLRE